MVPRGKRRGRGSNLILSSGSGIGRLAVKLFHKPITPVLLLIGLIFLLSSIPYHLQDLRPYLAKAQVEEWLSHLFSGMSFEYNGRIISIQTMGAPAMGEFFLRKFAHVFLYCCLAFCLMLALKRLSLWSKLINALLTLTVISGYAIFDEFYQGFIPQRTSSWNDVGIDLSGALLGIVLFTIRRDRDAKS